MIEKLQELKNEYQKIEQDLQDPEITKDIQKLTALSKKQAKLKPAVTFYERYHELQAELANTKELLEDEELGGLAIDEEKRLISELEKLEAEIKIFLIPKDAHDERNVIMEIRGAAGGDEANIFAGDLYRMYFKYAENQNWQIEMLNAEEGNAGGYTLVQFLIKGNDVYSHLKYESGAHRVQRVPTTETQGRVHTSTATVLVMPEAEDTDVEINQQDLRIDVFRSSGAGGQSVNTTDSAIRITHLPSGIVVNCQNERSQIRNKEKAMQMLKAKLYEKMEAEKQEKEGAERKSKLGSGDRSEKIRTYNFPQNRITDHRINLTLKKLDHVLEGDLNEIIDALIMEDNQKHLKAINE